MTVSLHVEYHAQWGAQVYVTTGAKPIVGQQLPQNAIDMDNDGRGNWFVDVDAKRLNATAYHYVLAYQRRVLRTEYGTGHRLTGLTEARGVPTLRVWDDWRRLPQIRSFFSLVFGRKRSNLRDPDPAIESLGPERLTMVCEAGKIADNQVLALIGNVPELGGWVPEQARVMHPIGRNLWSVTVSRASMRFPLRFKFVILEHGTHRFVAWEDCVNRFFEPSVLEPGDSIIICNQKFTKSATELL